MYKLSHAVGKPGCVGLADSNSTSDFLASTSLFHPRDSSSSPAHVERVPSIHEPTAILDNSGKSPLSLINSVGVTVTTEGWDSNLLYHS